MCSLVDFSPYKISTSNYNSMDCVYSIHWVSVFCVTTKDINLIVTSMDIFKNEQLQVKTCKKWNLLKFERDEWILNITFTSWRYEISTSKGDGTCFYLRANDFWGWWRWLLC